MKTTLDVSSFLEAERKSRKIPKNRLQKETGLSVNTVRGIFDGAHDPRLTTLMAVCDRLGLEMVIAPKEIADSLQQNHKATRTSVDSVVTAALKRTRDRRLK